MRKITIKDVAAHAGVSVTTASFALNNVTDRVNKQTQIRVLKSAEELGYVPNINASKLRKSVSDSIMLVYSQVFLEEQNASTTQFILNTIQTAKKYNKDVIIRAFKPYDDWNEMIQSYARLWLSRKIDGIIFLCSVDDNVPDYVFSKLYNEHKVNLVNATNPSQQINSKKDYPSIHEDLYAATINALNYIEKDGYKTIFYLGMDYKTFYPLRIQAYLDYIADNKVNGTLLKYNSIYRTKEDIWNLMSPILEKQNSDIAFMCWNDVDAISVLELLQIKEIKSPFRIGVIGYDDLPTAAHTVPTLTTIRNPYDEIAKLCVKTVCEQFKKQHTEPQNIVVNSKFIKRKSI